MSKSVNMVCLLGNVGRQPEYKVLQSGEGLLSFSMAMSESWKDKSGVQQESTEWVNITLFGKRAEALSRFIDKGQKLYVRGRLKTRKYQASDGTDRYSTGVVADDVVFCGSRGEAGKQSSHETDERASHETESSYVPPDGDDIPF